MRESREGDLLHLLRMRDAAQLALQTVSNRNRDDLEKDPILQLGLAKAVELIGEAASRVSDELQTQQTQLPWRKIIGMRHVLVHNYWYVELDVVWETVRTDIPALITTLEPLIAMEDERRKG